MFIRNRIIILLWVALSVAAMWIVLFQTKYVTDMTRLMPDAVNPVDRLVLKQLRKGVSSRVILIALRGASSTSLAQTSENLADRLRKSGLFVVVNNGDFESFAHDRELIQKNRYLLSNRVMRNRFTGKSLRKSLQSQLQMFLSPTGSILKTLLPRDPTGETIHLLREWSSFGKEPMHKHGYWFSADGRRALMMVETKAPAFALAEQSRIQIRIREEFTAASSGETIELVMTGPAVFAVESRSSIRKEVFWFSVISGVLVLSFLLIVYRSPWFLLFSAIPLLTGILAGAAIASMVFDHLHAITFAFGITIIGVAIDYPIHFITHRLPKEHAETTIKRIWPTLSLSVITTALGFTAMAFSGFTGLAQLGMFTIVGLLSAALVTRYILPILTRETNIQVRPSKFIITSMTLIQRMKWLPLAVAGVSIIYIGMAKHEFWSNDIVDLSPVSEQKKMLDRSLRQDLGAADVSKLVVILDNSQESVLRKSEKLAYRLNSLVKRKIISGYDTPSRYLPSQYTQNRRQLALPTPSDLRRSLRGAMKTLPFREGIFDPFIKDIASARSSSLLTLSGFGGTALGTKLHSMLFQHGQQWVALVLFQGVKDEASLIASVRDMKLQGVSYLDLKSASSRMINHYRDEVLILISWGTGIIFLVLVLRLRSVIATVRILLPILAAESALFALFLMTDQKLTIFHLIGMLVVLGVGLDYSLFFNRHYQNQLELQRTHQALVVCSFTTIMVFGVLGFSHAPVLNTIGVTVAVGSFLCLLLAASSSRGTCVDVPSYK